MPPSSTITSPSTDLPTPSVSGEILPLENANKAPATPAKPPATAKAAHCWRRTSMPMASARSTDYWHALLGAVILILVLLFPQGIAGFFGQLWQARRLPAGGVR